MVCRFLRDYVFEVITFTFTFFVPLQEQWSKTLSPANIEQKNFAILSSQYALSIAKTLQMT